MQVFKNNVSLEATPTGDTHITNKGYVDRVCGGQLPIGAIVPFSGSVIPYGYLLCDGQEISRTEYSTLFSVIGEIFGSGDGSTTFNVPDLRDKFPQGASGTNTAGTVKEAGLPNITGEFYHDSITSSSISGAFRYSAGSLQNLSGGANKTSGAVSFDASRSSSIYGNSDTVQPPSVCVNYIIRAKVAETTTLTGESYSTEEQVIGTWIDGKPIYRKVIQSTTSSDGSAKYISIGVNIDEFVSMYCLVKSIDSQYIPSGFNHEGNYTVSIDGFNNLGNTKANKVGVRHKGYPNLPVTIIIEYTKTTD